METCWGNYFFSVLVKLKLKDCEYFFKGEKLKNNSEVYDLKIKNRIDDSFCFWRIRVACLHILGDFARFFHSLPDTILEMIQLRS